MTREMESSESDRKRGVVTYIIMDDPSVTPMSIISLLNRFDVKLYFYIHLKFNKEHLKYDHVIEIGILVYQDGSLLLLLDRILFWIPPYLIR